MKKITIQNCHFVNEDGQEVLLNGINFVCKEEKHGYIWPDAERLMKDFAGKGFNFIRLGIFWNAAEPQPGVYDDAYLARVKAVICGAEENGIYVLLDMHQDLFSCVYGDGAPAWATLTDGKPHPAECTMWYNAYLQSEAIIAAADHFWQNDPAPDGMGLVDHYEKTWLHIAETLKDCGNIMGAEMMNEPFMGSLARNAFGMAAFQVQQQYPEFDLMGQKGITPESQGMFTQLVGDQFVKFDRDTLVPFYARLSAALRKVWDVPFVACGNIYCSSMFPSGMERLQLPDGQPEVLQAYDIHAYDAVVDTASLDNYNLPLMELQLSQKRAVQERLGMPAILGEWGAFPSLPFANTLIAHTNAAIEKYLWSTAYWQYLPGMEADANYDALVRGYPMETEGELTAYHWDISEKTLIVRLRGKAVTCFVPGTPVTVEGAENWQIVRTTEKGCVLLVSFMGEGEHAVTIRA